MSKEHNFYDYLDGSGGNAIKDWLTDGGSIARFKFNIRIELLSASPPGDNRDSVWRPNFVKPLEEDGWKKYKDFIELRAKVNREQYRLIGKKIDREILLVGWGFHDGKGWNTSITPAMAQDRVNQMISNPGKYKVEHEI
jgi:hypothetical protein